MKRSMLFVASWLVFAGVAFAGDGGKLPFSKDYQAGMKEAAGSGMPFVLYFTAEW